MKKIYYLILCSLILSSCSNCEDSSEPIARIYFRGHQYENARGINSDKLIDPELYDDGYPISIVSDTTSYLFFDATSTDTLSIRYKRIFHFESKVCGFTVTCKDFQLLESSSFDSVNFEIRESSYIYPFESKRNEYFIEIFN